MRKTVFFIILALLTALPSMAQSFHFKFGGGLASHYGSAQVVGAYKIGVGYEIEFDQHFTFTPSLEFYGKGWKEPNATVAKLGENGEQLYDEDGTPLTGIMNRTATQNYIEVPLLFSYYLRTGESRYVMFGLGPYVAYGVGGKQKTKGDTTLPDASRFYYEKKTFNEPGTHRFDCGVQAVLGYQFPSGVTVGLEGDFGLAKFNAAGDRNISGLISIGYKL